MEVGQEGLLVAHQSQTLSIRGVGEPYANDARPKISGQFVIQLRWRTSRRMELKAFFMSSFAGMYLGDLVIILAE